MFCFFITLDPLSFCIVRVVVQTMEYHPTIVSDALSISSAFSSVSSRPSSTTASSLANLNHWLSYIIRAFDMSSSLDPSS